MFRATILMGLPLAGKSTWISENKSKLYPSGVTIVSADEIKIAHPDFDPNKAYLLHQYSVEEAEKEMMTLSDSGQNIIMDSGSINNSYTMRIINNLKKKGYDVDLVHIKTPYQICLKRNQERERKVPEEDILHKAAKENKQFYRLVKLVDSVKVVDYFTNEHLFVDMDGVIAALSTLPVINGEIDFVNGEIHKHLLPVTPVINKLKSLINRGKKVYILSAIPNSFSLEEKNHWLDKHFNIPKENRFFVNQGKHKGEMLGNLSKHLKIPKKSITMIDDIHDTLYNVKDRGMNSMHISEFLIYEF